MAILITFLSQPTLAGAHPLEVIPEDHWVYGTLYSLAAKGLAPLWAASTRPLTRLEIARMIAWSLNRLSADRNLFTQSDLSDLETLVSEFADELALMGYRIVYPPQGPSALALTGWGMRLERALVGRIEGGQPPWYERQRGSGFALQVRGSLGFGPVLMAGTEILHGLRFDLPAAEAVQRLYMSGEYMGATVQVGRDTLWWGPASRGAFLLSDNAGPLEFLRLTITGERLRFTKVVAPLDYQGRFLYGMRLDWLPREDLRVGLAGTVVGRGGIDFDWMARRGVLAYGEVYVDDLTMPGDPFPSRLGLTMGLYLSDPLRDGRTTLRVEHTRSTNWLYTTSDRTNDYVRGGRSLGHWCAPDCELWSAEVRYQLPGNASVQLSYDLVRKGQGQLGETWGSVEEAWSRLYLSGVVETTQALRLRYAWTQAFGLQQAVSVTWSVATNAGHQAGFTRGEWFLRWEARYAF